MSSLAGDFGIPDYALIPLPPSGAEAAAVGELHDGVALVGYMLIAVRIWTQKGRGVPTVTRALPDVLIEWTDGREPPFEDAILVEENGARMHSMLRERKMVSGTRTYDVVWRPWTEMQPIYDEYFA